MDHLWPSSAHAIVYPDCKIRLFQGYITCLFRGEEQLLLLEHIEVIGCARMELVGGKAAADPMFAIAASMEDKVGSSKSK